MIPWFDGTEHPKFILFFFMQNEGIAEVDADG